jgi:hypothetical protein
MCSPIAQWIASGVEGLSGTVYGFNLINHAILADTTTTGKDRSFMLNGVVGSWRICGTILMTVRFIIYTVFTISIIWFF